MGRASILAPDGTTLVEAKAHGKESIGTDINPMGYTAGSMMVDKFFTVPYAVDENYISDDEFFDDFFED